MADIGTICSAAIAGNVDAIARLEMEAEKLDDVYKRSILHTEAQKGNTEHVRFIVRNIANKKNLWVKLDSVNQTALHYAVYHRQCDVVEVLIDGARQFFQDNDYPHKSVSSFPANDDDPHKSAVTSFQAYIRQVNINSDTALSYGVKRGCLRCVKMLVEADPTDRHTLNNQGKSPLYRAAKKGHTDIVEMIYTTCTAPSLDGPGGGTALHAAIKHLNKAKEKNTDVIRMIIDAAKRSCTPPYGSFDDLFNQTDESGHTVIELAVIGNQVNLVDLILKENPASQIRGKNGLMRLIYKTIDEEDTDSVKLMSKAYDGVGHKGATDLILAIKRRDKDSVVLLLRYDKHLATFAEDEGWTPLHYAAYHEFDSILDTIIEAQKDLGYEFVYEDKVQTPLLVAAEKGYTSTVIRLVELWPTSSSAYTAINNNGQNILHLAAAKNKKEMIEGILKYCPEKYKDDLLKRQDANSDTPLHLLISHGVMYSDLSCVKMLVEADPTDRHTLNDEGKSPMYRAAEEGCNDIVKMICTTCTAPSLDGPGGSTALHAAIKRLNQAKEKDTDVIRMVIDAAKRSCTPPYGSFEDLFNQIDESGHTVLQLAVIGNQVNMVDLILKEDPAYQHSGPSKAFHGATALILAIKMRHKDSVLHLLGGAKHLATFAEDEGWTPLHYAADHEFDSILETIIEAQKDLRYQFIYEDKVRTPLLVAAEKGYTSTVIRLMELWPTSSSACTAINNNGQNILHLAAAKNKKEMIEGILKYCPEKYKDDLLKRQDANGDTPLHLLIAHGCFIPKLIQHKGLDTMVRNKRYWTPRDMLYSTDDIIADQVKIKIALDDVQTNQSRNFWRKNMKNMKKKTDILESFVLPSDREAKDVKFNENAIVLIDEKRAQMKKDLERYKKRTSTQIIVATLITTVTFTVGFTMPGGLRQSGEVNEGLVVLIKKAAFNAFMVSDALAFLLSTCSLFLYFLESMHEDPHQVSILNAASVGLNIISVMAMMLTFITGTYVVLSHSPALAVTICLIGSFFFIFVIVLLIKIVYDCQVKRNFED